MDQNLSNEKIPGIVDVQEQGTRTITITDEAVRQDPSIFYKIRHYYSNDANVILDVTDYDVSKLPPNLKCSLYTGAEKFEHKFLRTVKNFYAPNILHLSAPVLIESEDIILGKGDESEKISRTINLKALQKSRNLTLRNIDNIDLPALEESRDITAPQSITMNLPRLRVAADLLFYSVGKFVAAKLEEAGNISADVSKEFLTPLLVRASNIFAPLVTMRADLNQLKECFNLDFTNTILNIRNLVTGGNIKCRNATMDCPHLETIGNVDMPNLKSLYAPKLMTHGQFNVPPNAELDILTPLRGQWYIGKAKALARCLKLAAR